MFSNKSCRAGNSPKEFLSKKSRKSLTSHKLLNNATRVFSFIGIYIILVVLQLFSLPIFSICHHFRVINFVTKKKAFCKMPVTFPSEAEKNLAQSGSLLRGTFYQKQLILSFVY